MIQNSASSWCCCHGITNADCSEVFSSRLHRRSLGASALGLLLSGVWLHNAEAQEVQGTVRASFDDFLRATKARTALPASDRELVLMEVTVRPGAVAPLHHHPVPGLGYVVEGIAESAYGEEAPRRFAAGESFQDMANVPHTLFRNADPLKPMRFLSFYVQLPGQPYVVVP